SFNSASNSKILSSAQLLNFLNSRCIKAESVFSKYFNRSCFIREWYLSIEFGLPLKSPLIAELSPKIKRQISSFNTSFALVIAEKSKTECDSISEETSKLLTLNIPDLDFKLFICEWVTFIPVKLNERWAAGVFSFLP